MKDLLFDRLHNGMGRVLDLRAQQSAMTAGNIYNTDTPNYKAKFIPFDELLKSQWERTIWRCAVTRLSFDPMQDRQKNWRSKK